MQISKIEEAVNLIANWAGIGPVASRLRKPTNPSVPEALPTVIEAAEKLALVLPTNKASQLSLLTVQERIFRPEEMHLDDDGISIFINENQGVHAFGFYPEESDLLYVSGDWSDRTGSRTPESWRQISGTPEDALVFAVLMNGFFALTDLFEFESNDTFDRRPDDLDVLLWSGKSIGCAAQFWTNSDQTELHFLGLGTTLKREKSTSTWNN